MTYAIAKAAIDAIENEYNIAVATLKAVSGDERGPFGLTPDHIKKTPEWRAAWNNERRLFGVLRMANMDMGKMYSKEMKAEREERRAARLVK